MPRTCSCAATLLEDARFCHRCGKPTFEEPSAQREVPVIENRTLPTNEPGISFSDQIALRIAILVGIASTLLDFSPVVMVAPLLGGLTAVFLYARRTGRRLTTREGAKLGWITGLVNTLLFTVFFSMLMAWNGAALINRFRAEMQAQHLPLEQQQVLSTSSGLLTLALVSWIFLFGFTTLLHMAGGALGAKLTGKRR